MSEEIIEDIRKAVEGSDEKPKLEKAELLGIKFITTKKGADLLNDISRIFDLVDEKQKDSKKELIDQDKKVKFKVPTDFLDHTEYLEYETTEAGLRHFKHLSDPNKDQREYDQAVEMENLTFLDGVLLTWNIFEKILDKRLRDENGDPEKGICKGYSYEYLGVINDDINDLILNEVLELGYFKHHGEHLHELFEIGSSAYVRPAWMRKDNNCIDTKSSNEIASMH